MAADLISRSAVRPETAKPGQTPGGAQSSAPDGKATAAEPDQEMLKKLDENSARLEELSAEHKADLNDPASLDELARKVYPRLRRLLRAELLVDRERAGLLGELG
jgi:hypothetical protein